MSIFIPKGDVKLSGCFRGNEQGKPLKYLKAKNAGFASDRNSMHKQKKTSWTSLRFSSV
ncbi:hypothetical protein QY95_01320 [Bacillus thermotolerans]|uniref:Uncharacterized protein n=1 Tax=Bacillus thermotolerans TaxID=1221996 RepID=A0A0F5I5D8_BACTR|nr:hypothetical protein QY95_01320 [Bacillus thermotolerans]